MRLLELIVENFGVYEGAASFRLTPRQGMNDERNITIIHGPNGSGKSTLFKSLNLALYGKLSLGQRVTQKQYDQFILNRLHSNMDGTQSCKARLSLDLELTLSGVSRVLSIERTWLRSRETVQESFRVLLDGAFPPIRETDHQDWLNSLIHPGTVQSIFFDAEQLDSFADPERHDEQLKTTLDRLLGLDLISRLHSDIMTFLLNDAEGKALKQLKGEYHETSEQLAALQKQEESVRKVLDGKHRLKEKEVAALEAKERAFVERGGNYALRRKEIELEVNRIEETLKKHRADVRSLCSELLPLALAPKVTKRFIEQLRKEKNFKKARHAHDSLLERKDAILKRILSAPEWEELGVTTQEDTQRLEFLSRILREEMDISLHHETLVHDVSDSDFNLYSSWIEKAFKVDAPLLIDLCEKLRECEERAADLQADLERTPDESTIKQQQEKIKENKERIHGIDIKINQLEEDLQRTKEQILKEEQKQNGIVKGLGVHFMQEKRTDLALRAQGALATYRELLRRNKLQYVEDAFIETFNRICRKDRFIKGISINPDDFSTKIEHSDGSILALDQLSAAERQLYVYSLIGGIHKASGLPLPLVIDTPLARFDTTHRSRLVTDFFPNVSNQVILFATDEEEEAFREHGGDKWTIFSYRLAFDDQTARSTATPILSSQEAMYP